MFVIYQGLRNPKPHLQQIIFLSTLAGGGIMLRNIFIFFLLMSLTSQVNAAEKFYGGFIYNSAIPQTLFFNGEISTADSFELRRALRDQDIDTIVLASPGGLVFEGLQLAGIINDNGLRTYVPKNASCASACSFMFFAGKERQSDGELGVHQTFSPVGQTQVQAQVTVSEIIGFLNQFGTPAFVYEKMFRDQDMYWFNQHELKQLNSKRFKLANASLELINKYAAEITKIEPLQQKEVINPEPSPPKETPNTQTFVTSYYTFPENFTAKLKGTNTRLNVSIGVSTQYDATVINNVEMHQLSLRSEILSAMSEHTLRDIEGKAGRDALAEQIMFAINKKLEILEGFGGVEGVFFTSFILQ